VYENMCHDKLSDKFQKFATCRKLSLFVQALHIFSNNAHVNFLIGHNCRAFT